MRVGEQTLIGSISNEGQIQLSAFDHGTGSLETNGIATVTADDHSNPAVFVREDGHIIAFWSDRFSNQDEMRWRISDSPGDISSFGALRTFTGSDNLNYAEPVTFGGEIRLYYRVGPIGSGVWAYRASTDGGETFGSPQTIADWGAATYIHVYEDGERLHFASGDHREDTPQIRHWYEESGDYYTSDGTLTQSASDPITDESLLTTVFDPTDPGNAPPKQYDLTVKNGNPYVAFTQHEETGFGGSGAGDYRARWAKWDGSQWVVGSQITEMGGAIPEGHYYEGGLSLDSQDPTTVYVSAETADRNYQIQEWTTDDEGSTWTKVQDLSPSGSTFVDPTKRGRPVSPRNHGGDLSALWWEGRYDDFVDEFDLRIQIPDHS